MTIDQISGEPGSVGYVERFKSPEVQALLRLHFAERIRLGILRAYKTAHEDIRDSHHLYEDGDYWAGKTQKAIDAEAMFVLVADTGPEYDENSIVWEACIALIKVNPDGTQIDDSFVTLTDVHNSQVHEAGDGFSQEQADLTLRQANEQIQIGLHPAMVYGASWGSPAVTS